MVSSSHRLARSSCAQSRFLRGPDHWGFPTSVGVDDRLWGATEAQAWGRAGSRSPQARAFWRRSPHRRPFSKPAMGRGGPGGPRSEGAKATIDGCAKTGRQEKGPAVRSGFFVPDNAETQGAPGDIGSFRLVLPAPTRVAPDQRDEVTRRKQTRPQSAASWRSRGRVICDQRMVDRLHTTPTSGNASASSPCPPETWRRCRGSRPGEGDRAQ